MKASELTQPGFYFWQCPSDDGPQYMRGRPMTVIQVGVEGFGMKTTADPCRDCFFPGNAMTWCTRNLPGEFIGPINMLDPIQQ